jgi:hypothetical protein
LNNECLEDAGIDFSDGDSRLDEPAAAAGGSITKMTGLPQQECLNSM